MQNMTQGQVGGRSKDVAQGVLEAAGEKLRDFVDDRSEEREETRGPRRKER
jgi:hypothetical protein